MPFANQLASKRAARSAALHLPQSNGVNRMPQRLRSNARRQSLSPMEQVTIERAFDISSHNVQEDLVDLFEVVTKAGLSVGFTLPFNRVLAAAYWREAAVAIAREHQMMVWARSAEGEIMGIGQLVLCKLQSAWHRAQIESLLVR